MKYARILSAVAQQVWAMQPEKLSAMLEFLRFAADGGVNTPDMLAAKIGKREDRAIAQRSGAVMVLPIVGIIGYRMSMMDDISGGGGFSVAAFRQQFHAAVNDDSIKLIILDVDSPGGVIGGVPELARDIAAARARKTIISVVNPLSASAGYWLAAAATEVVASPSSDTGSVGVYTVHEDWSKYLEAEGIGHEFIHYGEHKVEGNSWEPLSDSARQHLQARVDEAGEMFTGDLATFRDIKQSVVRETFGGGRVYGPAEAMSRGMVDRIATLEETLARFEVGPLAITSQQPPDGRSAHRRALAERRLALLEHSIT
ncbi:S49 family peptidase [Flagellatimonas centrodinii]|uniref:S49 family peptidase n=1 Tax=Flagellatimonas centrodinii TaxID=2806210 RepID=UPI001FEDCF93|nr:S49 family peptidase [Flagellatimonas centrodinii]ULQ45863.1 S49 family peptidase [Flagellatimonas centrodinii]